MRIEFLQEYTAKTAGGETRTVAAGTVLDLSPDKGNRLVAAGVALDLDAVISTWREFATSADKVFRTSSVSSDSWMLHKNHLQAAQALFKTGRMPEARVELDKALTALRYASGQSNNTGRLDCVVSGRNQETTNKEAKKVH